MFTARAAVIAIVNSEAAAWITKTVRARVVTGTVSVALNAVDVENDKYK